MALQAKYQQYLARPTADALATNAAVNYIPTLTTINGSAAILKHLSAQQEQLTKKSETVLNVIESANGICVETETTLQFLYGGGAYLPGMDDNFLADREATVLIVHVVTFDSEQKIQQIRLLWDQGSLLKSIDVIGRSGRNWPLHDGKQQARLTASSAATYPSTVVATTEQKPIRRHSRVGSKDESRKPLDLFSPRTFERAESPKNSVEPRESAKPPPRDYGDLFASNETAAGESTSPSKRRQSHIKVGAGKNFAANRLFDQMLGQPVATMASIKTNPGKFNHFDIGETSIAETAKPTRPNVHGAQWDFADFSTPIKKPVVRRPQDVRHFGLGDDVGDAVDVPRVNHVAKGRRDAASHFSFDDVTPTAEKQQAFEPGRGAGGNGRAGLYEDHVIDQNSATNKDIAKEQRFEPGRAAGNGRTGLYEDHVIDQNSATNKDIWKEQPFEPQRAASTGRPGLYEDHITHQHNTVDNLNNSQVGGNVLAPITNLKQHQHQRKAFESNWDIAEEKHEGDDVSKDENVNVNANANVTSLNQAKQRAAKTMQAAWSMYDESPQKQGQQLGGIKIAGNGMGGRSGGMGAGGLWDF